MAVTKITYTGNGSQTQFTIPFEYIAEADVDVYIDTVLQLQQNTTSTADPTHPQVISGDITQGTALINYTFANATTIQFNSAPANGAFIFIERTTDDTSIVTFTPGSTIRAQELNSALEQVRFIAQEGTNTAQDGVVASKDNSASIDGQGKRLENLADANSDDDAVTRAQLGKVITDDLLEGEAIDLTDATGGSNSNKQVTISVEDSSKTNKGAVSINEGHAIGVTYTSGDAVIAADKSTASQQGVVKITAPSVTNGNPITLTRPADGEVELTIADGSIDVQKIKGLDKADTSEYASTWDNDDDQVATVGAIAKRLDAIVSTSQPTTAQVGKFWYNPTEGINALYMWTGTEWKVLTSGTPYIPAGTTIVRYVDAVNGSDDVNNSGFLPQSPLRTIKRALTLINASASGDGTLVVVEPGVYQEELPLRIEKNNISVVGKSLRSCFIHPTVATENNNMWEVDSGTYISGFTLLGLKVPTANQGSRNNPIDNDSTYGIPSNHPFAVSFRSGNPVILKSPYIQNCTHFSDAHFDNANFDPNTFQSTDAQTYSAVAGDQSSAPCGGGLLVDGSVPAQSSPIRSMVVDAFTQITLDAPGIIVTNNGYAQLVSFFGTFCHYHAKAKNGGQINLSNCVTDFGRFGLIAEGKSPTPIATATASAANAGATTVTIGAITTDSGFHGTVSRPLDHMMITIDGTDYGVVSSTANGSGWDVTITPALASNISNTAVSFALRSYISTGGHTFEYVGVGTDYGSHPDNGGVAVEANQVKEFNGGKVWQSSTDHIGKFKAGNVLTVDQVSETVAVNGSVTVTGTNAVNGNITVTGTVDGRDVATDGTKLDGIEAGATADQTAAEIRTLVESATDSNVFTDADHTKLNGIETGATADQTATEIKTAYESNSNTNAFTDAEKTKLSGIATGATAYANSDVDAHLNQSTAASGEVLSWNGSDYDWVAAASGGASNINGLSDAITNSSGGTIGIGTGALANDDGSGNVNTALGYNSLNGVTSGSQNSAVGYNAGNSITTGSNLTVIGYNAASSSATATNEITLGNSSVTSLRIPGLQSGATNGDVLTYNSSNGNITLAAGGATSLDGLSDAVVKFTTTSTSASIGIGENALNSDDSSENENTAVGIGALQNNTTGPGNEAFGRNALNSNTTGFSNVAVGGSSLSNNTTGDQNVAVGSSALGNGNTTHNGSTAIGYRAGRFAASNYVTAVGYEAALNATASVVCVGHQAGKTATSATGLTAIGYQAGNSITTGSNLTVIGYDADASSATATNEITLGNASITSLRIPGLQSGAANGSVLTYNSTNGNITLAAGGLTNNSSISTSLGVGTNALDSETSGYQNTALGVNAGTNATTAHSCTLIGYQCGDTLTTGQQNTGVGREAFDALSTGSHNTAVGVKAGGSISGGSYNVAVGRNAGKSHSNGDNNTSVGANAAENLNSNNNTAIGFQALRGTVGSSTGGYNTAVGVSALESNTTGIQNTGLGYRAGVNITTGSNNAAVGQSALASLTGGSSNVAVGYLAAVSMAGNSSYNTCVGQSAGSNLSTSNSTAIGYNALLGTLGSSTGTNNTGVGSEAGKATTTGSNNTFVGYQAGLNNTTGGTNQFIGYQSGYSTTTGASNVFIGYKTGYSNTTHSVNQYIGDYAGYFALGDGNVAIGYQALMGNGATANRYNVAVGNHAGEDVTSGYDNTLIGWSAGSGITTGYNLIVIGKSAAPSSNTANEEITLGNSSISTLRCNTQTISSLSDGRDKTEVEDLPLGLDFIDTLRPVKFKWDTRDGNGKDGTYDAGFIAQDLQSAQSTSDAEYLKMVMDSNPDRLEAAYGQLIPVLVQAIKDLKSEIETLKSNV